MVVASPYSLVILMSLFVHHVLRDFSILESHGNLGACCDFYPNTACHVLKDASSLVGNMHNVRKPMQFFNKSF